MQVPEIIEYSLKHFDPRLRIRWARSKRCFVVEQRFYPKQILDPKKFRNEDAYICSRDGYCHLMDVAYFNLNKVMWFLKNAAPWRKAKLYTKGYQVIDQEFRQMEEEREKQRLKEQESVLDSCASDAFNQLAWIEQRRISTYISPKLEAIRLSL